MISIIASSAPGLSPLARGTLAVALQFCFCHRFIPAGAGNTPDSASSLRPGAVYPRWRGEHCIALASSLTDAGLSPLARGTQYHCFFFGAQPRFIPAGAGNTFTYLYLHAQSTVYPRWRGEHPFSIEQKDFNTGLSPLARGTQYRPVVRFLRARFIPAGAENTWKSPPRAPRCPVYPRWRGEHPSAKMPFSSSVGLSPLARGTPRARR